MANIRVSVYFYNFQNPWSRRSVAHGSTLPKNKASTFCLSCWPQMFWNNCPGLLCYMLAFYPNVHLISIRMSVYMNRSQISSHFLHRHPSEGNSSPTLEHHPAGCLPLSKALRQVPWNLRNQQMNFIHPFGSLSYYKNEGEKRIPAWRGDEAWGQGQEEAPHRLPSSPDSPCWQSQPSSPAHRPSTILSPEGPFFTPPLSSPPALCSAQFYFSPVKTQAQSPMTEAAIAVIRAVKV